MVRVTKTDDAVDIRSETPGLQRVIMIALAFVPLLAPYELLLRPDWQGNYGNIVFVFAALISLGALSISASLVIGAVAGRSMHMRFDRSLGQMVFTSRSAMQRPQAVQVPLESIMQVSLKESTWSDGPPSYAFVVETANGGTYKTGSSLTKTQGDDLVRRVNALLSPGQAAAG